MNIGVLNWKSEVCISTEHPSRSTKISKIGKCGLKVYLKLKKIIFWKTTLLEKKGGEHAWRITLNTNGICNFVLWFIAHNLVRVAYDFSDYYYFFIFCTSFVPTDAVPNCPARIHAGITQAWIYEMGVGVAKGPHSPIKSVKIGLYHLWCVYHYNFLDSIFSFIFIFLGTKWLTHNLLLLRIILQYLDSLATSIKPILLPLVKHL